MNPRRKLFALLLGSVTAWANAPAFSQPSTTDHTDHHLAQTQAVAPTDGEVRKVDADAKKITIRHGPIVNLDMPAMTMVFQVKELVLLEKVKSGDKIKFRADKIGGLFTVTHIEPVR